MRSPTTILLSATLALAAGIAAVLIVAHLAQRVLG
jgi:hypothetical protein